MFIWYFKANHTLIENQAIANPPKIKINNKVKCSPTTHIKLINSDQKEGLGGKLKLKLIINNQEIIKLPLSQNKSRLLFLDLPAKKNMVEEINPWVNAIRIKVLIP